MSMEVPIFEKCCDKEPFAFYGLASYAAQLMEYSALNLLLVLSLPEMNLCTKQLFDEITANLEKKTFGQLLKKCKSKINISEQEIETLNEALELRNFLVHHFYKDHAENFISVDGIQEMVKELRVLTAKFDCADLILEKTYKPLWLKYGFTEEAAEKELKKIYEKAAQRDKYA